MSIERLPASFRGVRFEVQLESEEGGRRVQTWEFPQRDKPAGQDLGRQARRFRLTAFVNGDDAAEQRNRLLTALETTGPGLLVHPSRGPISVRCVGFTRTESLDDSRTVAFELQFIESTEQPAPTLSVDAAGALSSAAAATMSAAANAYSAAVSYAGQIDAVQQGLITDIRNTTASIRRFTTQGPLARQVARSAELAAALDELDDSITALAAAPETYAITLQNALLLVSHISLFRLFTQDAGTSTPALSGTPATWQTTKRTNTEAQRQLYTHSALAAHGLALSQTMASGELNRPQSLTELGILSDRIDAELELTIDANTGEQLFAVRQQAQADTLARIQALPEIQAVTFGEPTSWLAETWRLYGSTEAADRLWRDNGRGDPLLVMGTVNVEVA